MQVKYAHIESHLFGLQFTGRILKKKSEYHSNLSSMPEKMVGGLQYLLSKSVLSVQVPIKGQKLYGLDIYIIKAIILN